MEVVVVYLGDVRVGHYDERKIPQRLDSMCEAGGQE